MYKVIFFDLDGTLLNMDEEAFVRAYLQSICTCFAGRLDPVPLQKALFAGMEAMQTIPENNEQVMFDTLEKLLGPEVRDMKEDFLDYYRTRFNEAAGSCKPVPQIQDMLEKLKTNCRLVLATDPIFPIEAVRTRLQWAGIDPDLFEWITSYETNRACKPDKTYYQDLLDRLGVQPDEVLMVGNDVQKDMEGAEAAGIDGFLITNCLIDRTGRAGAYPHGDFSDLWMYLH